MTQASSKRPKELLEEIEQKLKTEVETAPKLVFRTSRQEIFSKTMEVWFDSLSDKKRRLITPKALKRKAIHVCYSIDIVYERLSKDWIKKLEARGLKLYKKKKESTKSINEQPSATSLHVINGSSGTEEKSRNVKKVVDLTDQLPPPFWLENYAKGIILPRVLTIHSTTDANILFYDYNPKLKDEFGRDFKLPIAKRHTGQTIFAFEK